MVAVGWRNFYYAIRRNLNTNQLKALCKIRRKNPNYTKVRFCTSSEAKVAVATSPLTVTVEAASTEPVEVPLGCQHALSLGNSIDIAYTFRNKEIVSGSGVKVSDYCHSVYAIATKEKWDCDTAEMTPERIECTLNDNGTYSFKYSGLAAKEMGKAVTVRIYGEDEAGNVVLQSKSPDVYSILAYATSSTGFGGNNSSLKRCLADMLNYGAAAQTYFNYNSNNLVNALDSVKDYVAANQTTDDLNLEDISSSTGSQSFRTTAALSLNSSIDLVAMVNPARLADYDLSTVYARFQYHNSKENKDYDIKIPYGDPDNFMEGSSYSFYCRTLAAAQVSEQITIAIYSGDTQLSKTTVYSVEAYCCQKINDSKADVNLKALATAIMRYGNSAKVTLGY